MCATEMRPCATGIPVHRGVGPSDGLTVWQYYSDITVEVNEGGDLLLDYRN